MCNYIQRLDDDDIYIYEDKLPYNVNAMVMPGSDGDYTICINQALSDEKKAQVVQHECSHIKNNHWELSLSAIEKEKTLK